MRRLWPVFLFALVSCQSQQASIVVEPVIYQPVDLEWDDALSREDSWPRASFHFSYYHTVLLPQDQALGAFSSWPRVEAPNGETIQASPIGTQVSPQPEISTSPREVSAPDPPPAPAPSPEPVHQPPQEHYLSELNFHYQSDDFLEIPLNGGGWEILPDLSTLANPMEERLNWQQSVYIFANPGQGEHRVVFRKQDHSTGGWLFQSCSIIVEAQAVETALNSEESLEVRDVMEEPPRSSREELRDYFFEELENEIPVKRIEVLERIITFHWPNEEMARFYYLLARELEKHGDTQDLRRAYDLYRRIEGEFFLSSYYSLAVERMEFLDQNFFRLQ